MKKYEEIKNDVYAMKWDGFNSMSEFIDFKGDAINVLLRHDESLVIFDNGYNLDCFIVVNKGQWIVSTSDGFVVLNERDFKAKYKEV